MRHKIVLEGTILTLFGGGEICAADAHRSLAISDAVVAADGGANFCARNDIEVDKIIGDLDSVHSQNPSDWPDSVLHKIDDQNSTDFEKCLSRIKADFILAHGFTGGRQDHELAALSALTAFPDQKCILIGTSDICFLCPLKLTLNLPPETRISLFPMAEMTGKSMGLKYPIDDLKMSPVGPISVSNAATGTVVLTFSKQAMLVILPKEHLKFVMQDLACSNID